MQHIPNISFIKTPDNPVTLAINSPDFSKEEKPYLQSFSNILQNQLSNTGSSAELTGAGKKYDAQNPAKDSGEKTLKDKNEFQADLNNKTLNTGEAAKKEKAKENSSSNINDNSAAKTKSKIEIENTKEKGKGIKIDEISFLLKTVNYILEMLKDTAFNKKQNSEIRSTLLELKSTLEAKNNNNVNKKSAASYIDPDFKNLLDRLKKLVETANERSGIKKLNPKEFNFAKNPDVDFKEIAVIGTLKKQISNLIDEIKQHLNVRKQENVISRNSEPAAENKNLNNQKIFNEVPSNEKNENMHSKDNGAAFNFSSFRKETEGSASILQKTNAGYTAKGSAFGDQLDTIMQNAKVTMRDSKNGSFSIRLYPESLGKVNVNLSLEQGVISGKFLVDSTDAKEALLENIQSVIDRLEENGISVGGFNVNVRDEKKSLFEFNEEASLYIAGRKQPVAAGVEYESNASYVHNGEIDMII
jgi:flagellar hook-length control protein FliK